MKKIFTIVSFLSLISIAGQAQFVEAGGSIGVYNYTGDMNRFPQIANSKLGGGAVCRFNFSPLVSTKFGLNYGSVAGSDATDPLDALAEVRQNNFKQNFFELTSVFEFHFLPYRGENKRQKLSPYVFFGVGFLKILSPLEAYDNYSSVQFVLPAGTGIKYVLTKQLTLGAELGLRKTYFDYLDGISDADLDVKYEYDFANPVDDDWYFFTGISLTYVFYKIPCPFPYIPNKPILSRIKRSK